MKSARNQLTLLGLVCLGFSWDDYFMPGLYLVAGVVCLRLARRGIAIPAWAEVLLMLAGAIFGYEMGSLPGRTPHFFIGHGLAWLQLARLLRPLTPRERMFSLIIAVFHIGVACTVVLDLRFALILPFVAWLAPKALMEMEAERFDGPAETPRPALPLTAVLMAVVVMVLFFVSFPRGVITPPMRATRLGPGDFGSLEDALMDPSRSARAQASRVLMQIQGEKIGYLRAFSLVETDGTIWQAAQRPPLKRLDYYTRDSLAPYSYRRVRVKQPAFLGKIFPTDGRVVFLTGNFFQQPLRNAHGGIQAMTVWNAINNVYEYWVDPNPEPEPLLRGLLRIYTNHPAQSRRLHAWLDQRLKGESDAFAQAKRLEAWFHNTYSYQLGAPALNRLNAVEDFVFNHREGHCERFAASLALLLRMKGIPARVVVGYVPSSKDWFSGWINVRFRDAHAWTEAWFPGRGWVQFDATPRGSGQPERSWTDLFDDIDFAWYAHVANFDRPTQNALFASISQGLAALPGLLEQNRLVLATLCAGVLLLVGFQQWRQKWRFRTRTAPDPRQASQVLAANYYGQMLKALLKLGFVRAPAQTPNEFLHELERQSAPLLVEARLVTELFCASRYGTLVLTTPLTHDLEAALRRIRELRPPTA